MPNLAERYTYKITWSEEDDVYIAVCVEYHGISAFGDTSEEALQEIKVAVELAIQGDLEDGEDVPQPLGTSGLKEKV